MSYCFGSEISMNQGKAHCPGLGHPSPFSGPVHKQQPLFHPGRVKQEQLGEIKVLVRGMGFVPRRGGTVWHAMEDVLVPQ